MTYSLCASNTLSSGAYSILWAFLTKTQGGEKSISLSLFPWQPGTVRNSVCWGQQRVFQQRLGFVFEGVLQC